MSFFVEPDLVPDVMRSVDEEVLPRFATLPHFLGVVALHSDRGPRTEIVAISLWDDDGLDESEEISQDLRDRVEQFTGTAPTRKTFGILRAMLRNRSGEVVLESP